tara:strand:+ start:636 stop:785 length:150 start_codon:yes stop_codon:yes gene_type:complete
MARYRDDKGKFISKQEWENQKKGPSGWDGLFIVVVLITIAALVVETGSW